MRPIRTCFKKADFRSPFVKILVNPQRIDCVFALQTQKFADLKFYDLKRMEFWADFWEKDVAGLSPGKDDKLKYAEITPFEVGSDS